MKKRIFFILSFLLISLLVLTYIYKPSKSTHPKTKNFTKGVWLSYYEENFNTESKQSFEASVDEIFSKLSKSDIDALFIHCRAFCDAIYKSDLFPFSNTVKHNSNDPDFDPLTVICDYANQYNISLHAWINPYRVSTKKITVDELPSDSAAKRLYNQDKDSVLCCDEGIYLNPANLNAKKLIIDGVREIIDNYDVDGIHFDDYFYPTTAESFDSVSYSNYLSTGGELSLADWRRANVNALISSVYSVVNGAKKDLIFGISPMCDIETNYSSYYADVEKWLSEDGLVDYICPQIYFGYNHPTQPFAQTLEKWKKLAGTGDTELYIGLAAYKVGKEDTYISQSNPSARNEWINDGMLLYNQAKQVLEDDSVSGFIMFSFNDYFSNELQENRKEISELKPTDL